jgi:hypothetical protein
VVTSEFVGDLHFENEYPTDATVDKLFDQLDFQRGCQAFLRNITASSMYSFRQGLRRDLGITSASQIAVWEDQFDARSLLLTANSETVYGITFLDLKADGPTVVEVAPGMLGVVNDMWMREVTNVGPAGPDQGRGGRFLFVPPGYDGELPRMASTSARRRHMGSGSCSGACGHRMARRPRRSHCSVKPASTHSPRWANPATPSL